MPAAQDTPAVRGEPTLADLRDRYLETHGNGTLEHHALRGIRRHFRHLGRLLGEGFPIRKLSLADLQGYVDKRAKAKGRRGTLNPSTIVKEIVTLRTAWNWGLRMKIVLGRYPYDGLRYPKSDEKPPYQTRAEIERQLPGPLTEDEAGDHLKRALSGSEWSVVRGWHNFRHSFISACASKGIDQRLIDEWVGHSTEQQRKRYRHLYPSVQAEALKSVFG